MQETISLPINFEINGGDNITKLLESFIRITEAIRPIFFFFKYHQRTSTKQYIHDKYVARDQFQNIPYTSYREWEKVEGS